MQLLTANIFVLIIFVVDSIQTELTPDGQGVCLKSETYEEVVNVKVYKPVTITKKKWCWSVKKLFSCPRTSTTLEEVTEPRIFTRTRIVPKCCDGYKEERELENNSKINCSPICRRCKHGKCMGPEICNCFSGFYGFQCDKECAEGLWGENCVNTCDCSGNGKCDKFTGVCNCEKGWIGERCESSCQPGYHGYMCKLKCDCGDSSCDHQTGECYTTTTTTTVPTTEPELYTTTESVATETSLEAHQQTEIFKRAFMNEILLEMAETVSEHISSSTEPSREEIMTITNINTSPTLTKDTEFSNTTNSERYMEITSSIDLRSNITLPHVFTSTTEIIREKIFETSIGGGNNAGRVVTKTINENMNVPMYITTDKTILTNLSGSVKDIDNFETDNFIRENKGNKKTMIKILNFLPSLSVFSSVSILTFIIAAFWLINKHRNKTRLILETPDQKNKSFHLEEQIKTPGENLFWSSHCTNNPVYLSDVDINCTIPVLETFKPLKNDKKGDYGEKEIR